MTELTAERDFIALAGGHMTALTGGHLSARQAASALQDILTSAQSVKAKAVMLCAQQCRDAALSAASDTPAPIHVLRRLIDQFAGGLFEIDPGARRATGYGLPDSAEDVAPEVLVTPVSTELAKQAARTLTPLIRFAPCENQPALRTLMTLSGQGQIASSAAHDNSARPSRHLVPLESIIAPITSRALTAAHLAYKQVSLSYACDEISVHNGLSTPLQALIGALCDILIERSVRHPTAREAAGQSGTAQISLTASHSQSGLMIDIFCDDLALSNTVLDSHVIGSALDAFAREGGRLDMAKGRETGALFSVHHPAPHGQRLPARPASASGSAQPIVQKAMA